MDGIELKDFCPYMIIIETPYYVEATIYDNNRNINDKLTRGSGSGLVGRRKRWAWLAGARGRGSVRVEPWVERGEQAG